MNYVEMVGILRDVYHTYYGGAKEFDVSGYISFWVPSVHLRGTYSIDRIKFYNTSLGLGVDKSRLKEGAKVRFKCSLGVPRRCWDIRLLGVSNLILTERPRNGEKEE